MADADKDRAALALFLTGVDLDQIRDQCGYRSVSSAQAGLRRALRASRHGKDLDTERTAELARIDQLYQAAWPAASEGDLQAIATCSALSDRRARLLDRADTAGGITAAYDATVDALDLTGRDQAIVAAGRAVARQIDHAIGHGTGQEVTKALYLTPHLMNVLRELGATPAARNAVAVAAGQTRDTATAQPRNDFADYLARHANA